MVRFRSANSQCSSAHPPQDPYDGVCSRGPRGGGPHGSGHGAVGGSRTPWRWQKATDQGLCGPIARNADIPAPAGCVGMGITVRSARVGRCRATRPGPSGQRKMERGARSSRCNARVRVGLCGCNLQEPAFPGTIGRELGLDRVAASQEHCAGFGRRNCSQCPPPPPPCPSARFSVP